MAKNRSIIVTYQYGTNPPVVQLFNKLNAVQKALNNASMKLNDIAATYDNTGKLPPGVSGDGPKAAMILFTTISNDGKYGGGVHMTIPDLTQSEFKFTEGVLKGELASVR